MTNTTAISDATDKQHCPRCGAINDCAIAQGKQQCWCMIETIGVTLPVSSNASCYCRDCLRALISNAVPSTHSPG